MHSHEVRCAFEAFNEELIQSFISLRQVGCIFAAMCSGEHIVFSQLGRQAVYGVK